MNDSDLERLLHSRRTEDRIRAVDKLRYSEPARKQEFLLVGLFDRSNYVATLSAELLSECADWQSCVRMCERFLHLSEDGIQRDPGCHIRAHLAFGFGRLDFLPAVDALKIGLKTVQIEAVAGVLFDTGAHLRANCALALAQMHAAGVVRDIALMLFETGYRWPGPGYPDPAGTKTRAVAAEALGRLGDPAGLIALSIKLKYPQDEPPEVLQQAMEAIVALQDSQAAVTLSPYLDHVDQGLAAYAALMIARSGVSEGPALVLEAMQRFTGQSLRGLVLGLVAIRRPDTEAVVSSLAEDGSVDVKLAIIEALAAMPDDTHRGLLRKMADADPLPRVRNAARAAAESA